LGAHRKWTKAQWREWSEFSLTWGEVGDRFLSLAGLSPSIAYDSTTSGTSSSTTSGTTTSGATSSAAGAAGDAGDASQGQEDASVSGGDSGGCGCGHSLLQAELEGGGLSLLPAIQVRGQGGCCCC
jgi:hypothetical protein